MKPLDIMLVGDGIENPHNAQTMIHAAEMFGCGCAFRDTHGLQAATVEGEQNVVEEVTISELASSHPFLIGFDNSAGAQAIYGFRAPPGVAGALVVGNERHGLSREMSAAVSTAVEIPMASKEINCLNVAAASGVGLYYLSRGSVGRLRTGGNPDRRRPEIMLMGGDDHVELGSAIRSACAFGWRRCLLDDPGGVWFGSERWKRAEGRAASRASRNTTRVVAVTESSRLSYRDVVVVNTRGIGTPLGRARLTGGPEQLVAIPDESRHCVEDLLETRFAGATPVHVELPAGRFIYHYRLVATIAMAEVFRQVGRGAPKRQERRGRDVPFYDKALDSAVSEAGVEFCLEDLLDY
jgi:tRNA G18 (ribose-2'-O)-methylase SpoU